MKYGVLGDIHSNLSALETVLAAMDRDGVETILSVGDVVGYGAAPKECVAILRERGVTVVLGNHDAAVSEILDDVHFNPYARAAVAWTQATLDEDERDWLRQLPLVATLEHCQVAHGTLHRPELFNYMLSATDAEPSLDALERQVCFVGHTHIPIAVMRFTGEPNQTAYTYDADVDLSDVDRALVNVGSVGQPRDDNPMSAYLVFDSDANLASLRRVPYDIEREVERIAAAGLPDVLGERLRLGV